jgi:hypothetical protein
MDYEMPRADTPPFLATALSEVPTPANRLGMRSGGEGGTTPALAAVIKAIVDGLAELGVRHIEMPATPERVLRAIQSGRSTAGVDREEPSGPRGPNHEVRNGMMRRASVGIHRPAVAENLLYRSNKPRLGYQTAGSRVEATARKA